MNAAKEIVEALTREDVTPDAHLEIERGKPTVYSVEWKFDNGAMLFLDISDEGEIQIVWKNKSKFFQDVINTKDDEDYKDNGHDEG